MFNFLFKCCTCVDQEDKKISDPLISSNETEENNLSETIVIPDELLEFCGLHKFDLTNINNTNDKGVTPLIQAIQYQSF